MSGLISSLHNSSGAIKVHSKGLEIVGKNLANINNRNYAKQRVEIGDRGQINTGIATESNGVEAMGLRQNRDALLDKSVMRELTATASLEATQKVLQNAETALGQFLDRTKDSTSIQNALRSGGGGISDALTDFFNAWESVSVKPGDIGEKQLLIEKAKILAEKINQTDERLEQVQLDVDEQVAVDVGEVNRILEEIGKINEYIAKAELVKPYSAVDLRDQRQAKLEELSKFVDVQFGPLMKTDGTTDPNGLGQIYVKSGDLTLVNGKDVSGKLNYSNRELSFDLNLKPTVAGGGVTQIEIPAFLKSPAATAPSFGTPPSITLSDPSATNESGAVPTAFLDGSGKLTNITVNPQGTNYTAATTATIRIPFKPLNPGANELVSPNGKISSQIETAGGSVQTARKEIEKLADELVKKVNEEFKNVVTSEKIFFNNAPTKGLIEFNNNLTSANLGTSDRPGGGNQIALAVAALGTQSFSNLGTASFTTYFNKTVTTVAQQLSSTNIRLEDQKLSEQNAVNSRDQYSGVSQDEEITDMMKFQRSFQASARHINVLDTLLEQVVNRLGVG